VSASRVTLRALFIGRSTASLCRPAVCVLDEVLVSARSAPAGPSRSTSRMWRSRWQLPWPGRRPRASGPAGDMRRVRWTGLDQRRRFVRRPRLAGPGPGRARLAVVRQLVGRGWEVAGRWS